LATVASSIVASNDCFQTVAKLTLMAEIGRVAAETRWPSEGQLSQHSRPKPAIPFSTISDT